MKDILGMAIAVTFCYWLADCPPLAEIHWKELAAMLGVFALILAFVFQYHEYRFWKESHAPGYGRWLKSLFRKEPQ